jgi:hypothetical protein
LNFSSFYFFFSYSFCLLGSHYFLQLWFLEVLV